MVKICAIWTQDTNLVTIIHWFGHPLSGVTPQKKSQTLLKAFGIYIIIIVLLNANIRQFGHLSRLKAKVYVSNCECKRASLDILVQIRFL